MAWDSSRPVPWLRLVREWLIYVGVMILVIVVFFRDGGVIGVLAGLLVSGPIYLAVGYVLAKFGYQRKTLKEMRTPRADAAPTKDDTAGSAAVGGDRPKPPPTRRTSTGINRKKAPKRR